MSQSATDTDPYVAEDGTEVESFGQMVRANNLQRIERRTRILRLRRQGFTYDQISEALARGDDEADPFEITPQGALHVVERYVAEITSENKESVETIRQIDNERLERMFKRLEADTFSNDARTRVNAVRAQLKVLERHARLNGLDEPVVHKHEGAIDHRMIADPEHVKQVEESFSRRHGGDVISLPAGGAREVT